MKKQNNKIKYFLYARKSSEGEDRQMASIDSQINELKRIAKKNNINIIETFTESKSAKAPGRPIFNEMIKRINNGEADGIICWKLNRLARNPIDGGEISWMLQQNTIKHIQTFGRSYYSNDNVITMAVELGMANQFIRDLSVDTRRGLRAKAEKGWLPCPAPLGYKNNPLKKKGEKEIVKDEERFESIKKMFDLLLSEKYAVSKIKDIATNDWGLRSKQSTKIAKSTLYRIFANPFYYGEFEYPKGSRNWYKGKHEPMISIDQYNRIQTILGKKNNIRPQKHSFPFTGMMRCGECGSMITAEHKTKIQKNGNIHKYTYYHCTKNKEVPCSQKTIRKEDLEKQIELILKDIKIPEEFKDWALKAIKKENKKENKDRISVVSSQQRQYNLCSRKLDKMIDMRINEELTEEEFLERKKNILQEKNRLKGLLEFSDNRQNTWIENISDLLSFSVKAKDRFENGTLEDKKTVLSRLGSNLILKDNILELQIKKPLLLIREVVPEINKIHNSLEPLKNEDIKAKLEELYSNSSILLR